MSSLVTIIFDLNKLKKGNCPLPENKGMVFDEIVGVAESVSIPDKIYVMCKFSIHPGNKDFEQLITFIPGMEVIQKNKINLFMEDIQLFQFKRGALKVTTKYILENII